MESLRWLSLFLIACADNLGAPERAEKAFRQAAETIESLRRIADGTE